MICHVIVMFECNRFFAKIIFENRFFHKSIFLCKPYFKVYLMNFHFKPFEKVDKCIIEFIDLKLHLFTDREFAIFPKSGKIC